MVKTPLFKFLFLEKSLEKICTEAGETKINDPFFGTQ